MFDKMFLDAQVYKYSDLIISTNILRHSYAIIDVRHINAFVKTIMYSSSMVLHKFTPQCNKVKGEGTPGD